MNKLLLILLLLLCFNSVYAQPIAKEDNIAITPGVKTKIDVLANDSYGGCTLSSIIASLAVVTSPDPSKGTIVKENGAFYYTPEATAVGTDSFTYKITCGSQSSTAKVNIQMGSYTGNIFPDRCSRDPGGFSFSMKELYQTSVETSNYFPAIIGDLNKDGNSEIIIPAIDGSHHEDNNRPYSKIYILNHKAEILHTITLPANSYLAITHNPVIGDFDNDGFGEVLIPANVGDKKLIMYKHNGTFSAEIAVPASMARTIGMADFDRDGYPEIYVGTSIYQYTSGTFTLLVSGNSGINTVAQDVDGDGIPELVGAVTTYKVNLSAGTVTANASMTAAGTSFGNTFALADIDLDGQIDVVTLTAETGTGLGKKINIRVWNPKDGSISYAIQTAGIEVSSGRSLGTSWPFIGDTDGNHYPDIVFMGGSNEASKTFVFRIEYNGSNNLTIRKSDNTFIDNSSRCTSMSMFDFNNDGANEIVYRDEENLYILDGSNTSGSGGALFFKRHKTIANCYSGTGWEYPVVASLTSTGESYVIMNSGPSKGAGLYWKGTLRIYGADTSIPGAKPWAQSRKVWNQFAFYQNTIDDNLKVIAYPLPLNYKMISSDGTKKLYPYNGHMMQRGMINVNTLTFFTPIADLMVDAVNYDYDVDANKMTIRITIINTGDAGMDPPIPIKVYKTVSGSRSLVVTQNYTETIPMGQTKVATIVLDNYSSLGDVEKVDVEVLTPVGQYDCNPNNGTGERATTLKAVADEAETEINQNVTIPVISNDLLSTCSSSSVAVSTVGAPTKGTSAVSGKQIVYTPATNNIGLPTFKYKISCDGNTSTAKVTVGIKSMIVVERKKNAAEPNIDGEFRIRFSNENATCDYPVEVDFKVVAPAGLAAEYTVNPSSTAIIPAGSNGVTIKVTPKNNFVVEGTRGDIELEITDVRIQ